jgi:hypothetical protein
MDRKQKHELRRKKKTKHIALMKEHNQRRDEAMDAFNLANYKIHLHSNPEQHAQMKEESSS